MADAETGPHAADHAHEARDDARFCLRCGSSLEARDVEGQSRSVCISCGRVHFREAKVAVTAAVVRDDALLLVRRRYPPERGKWGLPGGYLDAGEDPARAAARETFEETGLRVLEIELLDVLYNEERGGADISIVYRASVESHAPRAGDDAAEATFFRLTELPELAFSSTRRAVAVLAGERPGSHPRR